MVDPILPLVETLAELPPPQASSLVRIGELLASSSTCTVVLDDDPTGTQTVADVIVLTTWDVAALTNELSRGTSLFYILTNSRALPSQDAEQLATEIGHNLSMAASASGRTVRIVSRSDSTLRGHFPGEVDAVAEPLNQADAVRVLCPFFLEGGRYTIGDVHYAAETTESGQRLIPCAQTPFAQDAAFGYQHSNLIDWAIEKCDGALDRESIQSIAIETLRSQTPSEIATHLASLPPRSVVVVNAASIEDVETFTAAALEAESMGQSFLYRTAAGFVRGIAGQNAQPLLDRSACVTDAGPKPVGGLIVVGSYVPKTTQQWECLIQDEGDIVVHQINVDDALSPDALSMAQATANEITASLTSGKDVAICTSRQLRRVSAGEDSLDIGRQISRHLVAIVESIDTPVPWLIAKGGITSSDLATDALQCRRAEVLGQIAAGIPVWRMGEESRRPGLAYIIFPGNVGSVQTLRDVYRKLK